MQTTTMPTTGRVLDDGKGGGLIAESLDSALAGQMERFGRRLSDGTLDMATVLHDARTPLTVISGSAGMALRAAPEPLRPHLERIQESARLLEAILVRGLEFLRTNPEGAGGADLGALLLAAAALPEGTTMTLSSETVRGVDGIPFALRGLVEGVPDPGPAVPPSARRAVLRHGGSVWAEASSNGGTLFVAEVPCPRAA